MKRIFVLMLFYSLSSCAATKENNDLFESYTLYVNEIKRNKVNFVMSMLSINRANQIKKLDEKEFPVLSAFPVVLLKIESYYQKIENNKGCLTVNGYGIKNKPIVLSIKYLHENKKWGVDFVEIYYADSTKEFKKKGICPS